MRGTVDLGALQTLARRADTGGIAVAYGLVVVDEGHHVPAAAFENAVRQIRAAAGSARRQRRICG